MKPTERSSTGTLTVSVLAYAAWGVASAVAIIMIGQILAVLVSWVLPLNRADAAAGIITALAAVAGLSAPVAVARLRLSAVQVRIRRLER